MYGRECLVHVSFTCLSSPVRASKGLVAECKISHNKAYIPRKFALWQEVFIKNRQKMRILNAIVGGMPAESSRRRLQAQPKDAAPLNQIPKKTREIRGKNHRSARMRLSRRRTATPPQAPVAGFLPGEIGVRCFPRLFYFSRPYSISAPETASTCGGCPGSCRALKDAVPPAFYCGSATKSGPHNGIREKVHVETICNFGSRAYRAGPCPCRQQQ